MIDPFNITNFNRSQSELEEFWLFAICVAGKGADQQKIKLDNLLNEIKEDLSPFQKIKKMIDDGSFEDNLQKHKLGQYNRLSVAIKQSLSIDISTATLEELESIYGVSFKTSRFFVMHSRPDIKVAALDTHILKFLNDNGIEAPRVTPSSSKQYRDLELQFIKLTENYPHLSIAEIDLKIWSHYASKKEGTVIL